VRQRQLPFATQYHPTQRAVNVQQPRQVRRAHVVRVQKVLQGIQRGDFGRVELRVFLVVIFNPPQMMAANGNLVRGKDELEVLLVAATVEFRKDEVIVWQPQ